MEEKIFFERDGVSVSSARFTVHGQTYAMSGVTSVKQDVIHPSRLGPFLIGFLGCVGMMTEKGEFLWGLLTLVIALLWWINQKSIWIVVLNSSSGETKALKSNSSSYIKNVIAALNESIVYRG